MYGNPCLESVPLGTMSIQFLKLLEAPQMLAIDIRCSCFVPWGVDITPKGAGLDPLVSRGSLNSCQAVTALGHSQPGPRLNQ